MGLNLIRDAWLPVRRRSGRRERVRPADITDAIATDPVVALDFPRADWNAAVTEFLIGLIGLTFANAPQAQWADRFHRPPDPTDLFVRLDAFASAFELLGPGPRAFQDLDPLVDTDPRPVAALLMDAPGENAMRLNTDLFVERGRSRALSLPFAAAALITLQTYAPSGGAGHRTSLRGGGPLTLLVSPDPRHDGSLWAKLWVNVPSDHLADPPDLTTVFPWLRPTLTSERGQVVAPAGACPYLAFFACPRRLRLHLAEHPGICDLGGGLGPVITGLSTRAHGANYKGWVHPLSPYRQDPGGGLVAVHPKTESFDSRSFATWWGLNGVPAQTAANWQARRARAQVTAELELWGYDMDNMRARQWLERHLPWMALQQELDAPRRREVQDILTAFEVGVHALLHALKTAQFGQAQGANFVLPESLPRHALQELEADFRTHAEAALFAALGLYDEWPGAVPASDWAAQLQSRLQAAFEAGVAPIAPRPGHPARLDGARRRLAAALGAGGALERALIRTPARGRG